ncbi:hypothetical protein QR680_000426 [Steinernema hermaphroditum]|uniref:Uncharacterized protein n=1 Tax=Steinernema hermaphroditum TaxID=289476 RepID=A0AA39LE97_9BILA|nr:hypothetical protein QR680_000426 [Steinernema hermaphroditum]
MRLYNERYNAEELVHCLCIVSTISGLVIYYNRQQRSRLFGVLLIHIVTYVIYSTVSLCGSTLMTLQQNAILPELINHNNVYFWRTNLYLLGRYLASITSAFLALDRLLIMCLPIKYNHLRITYRLSVITIIIQLLGTSMAVYCNLNEKFRFHKFMNLKFLYISTMYGYIQHIFSFMVYSEVILYVAFCIAYWRYGRNQSNSAASSRSLRTNHIAVCQTATLAVFCMVPNALNDFNFFKYDGLSPSLCSLYLWNHLLYSTNVLLCSLYICYKFYQRPNKAVRISHTVATAERAALSNVS